ncbi:DUF2892 domain-containing protein [Kerstersia gyiorum]|uniref:DUF2892 family protein n=1 Tax=Kerstersia gyiorum TaxID=206506 RepID=A0A171KVK3_9BURK|nr:DUF2892 domain-containing protein [Kerstersia gyiorum]AZV94566.1 DUF2892 domain-containing protein [Bordetella sp. J329]MCO7638402.1 DUF2892 domain-containing protein [Pseudomonas sp. S 311-6]KAB0542650.1 DUF2892 domain-containing protein [Kerstersia gyiorum]KKO72920.1 membrane protein [Kerstersia gyiorum]MCH4272492.1 DUF2892 domain-containing protein [Kerstersia gyiorum]
MKSNVGGMDRVLRVVIGLVLIVLAAAGVIGWWGWLGVLPLLTGLARYCPLYRLLGLSTCPLQARKKTH